MALLWQSGMTQAIGLPRRSRNNESRLQDAQSLSPHTTSSCSLRPHTLAEWQQLKGACIRGAKLKGACIKAAYISRVVAA